MSSPIHVLDRAPFAPGRVRANEPPRVTERHGRSGGAYRCATAPVGGAAKRAFDVVVALAALIALSPALLLIALLIRLESRGPALFRQKRAGFRGRIFKIYKFRTMRVVEDGESVVQAVRGDQRVTRLGRILRRASIDELPQLLNVLKGDMSLVGPRPHAIVHEHAFHRYDVAYALRRMARPGITGLAQVSGARGMTDTPDKVARRTEFDLDYVRRWSLALDALILARTALAVFGDAEAL